MDDVHGLGRRSEVTHFLSLLRAELKLKDSDCIITGTYEHLKRKRVKNHDGVFISNRARHTQNILYILGLEQCNSAPTP